MGPGRPLLTPGQRNRSHLLLVALSGTLAAAAAAGTGVATAVAARETAGEQATREAASAAQQARVAADHHTALQAWARAHPVVVTTARKLRTVIGPTVVVRASAPGSARVGAGSSTGQAAIPYAGRPLRSAPAPAPAAPRAAAPVAPPAPAAPAPAPPPPPPPITTSGS